MNGSNTPLVSVIIPAYNHENYIQETIKSIINQTYKNIELIVIDDGSKDNTFKKILEMESDCKKRFSNHIFKTKINEGTCKTLNKLLSLSLGDYIYIIASDDIAKPDAIEKELSFLEKNPEYALCVGNNELIDSESKICYWDENKNIVYNKEIAKFLTFGQFLKLNEKNTTGTFGSYASLIVANHIPNGYLIRKSILKNFKFTPEAPLEDLYLMLHISKYAKMKYLDTILFSYRQHATNTVKQRDKMQKITTETQKYEITSLKKINLSKCKPDFIELIKMKKYKTIGIPYILSFEKYKNHFEKLKILKILNIPIIKYNKYKFLNIFE